MTRSDPPGPAAAQARFQAGLAFHQQGLLGQAQEHYQQALALQPNHFDALHLLGVIAAQQGDPAKAVILIRRAIEVDRTDPVAHSNLGNAYNALGGYQEALQSYERAIRLKPDYADAYNNRGNALKALGRFADALSSYERAIRLQPSLAEAHANRGTVLKELRQLNLAVESYERAIAIKPGHAEAWNNRGVALQELKHFDAALASLERAIALKPDYAEAHSNRGAVLQELKRLDEAVSSYEQAIRLLPEYAEAHSNRGAALQELGMLEQALSGYDRAIELRPDYAQAHCNRGTVLQALKRLDEALQSFDRAMELKPELADAHDGRGIVLLDLNRWDEAVASIEQAIALKPGFAAAYFHLGIASQMLRHPTEALAGLDKAITLSPDFAAAFNVRGNVFSDLRRYEQALEDYDRAIRIDADFADAYNNRGNALRELKLIDAAVANYGRALQLNPDYPFLSGVRLSAQMQACDWTDFEKKISELIAQINRGERATSPFPALALCDDLSVHRKAAAAWVADKHLADLTLGPIPRRPKPARLRIGYYSADYCNHATAYLMAELFEQHDRGAVEIIGFSFGGTPADEMRARLEAGFDKFIDVREMADKDVARLSREMEIDIAVDLKGFTQESRVGIFACRAAPLQVSYLGYPGTMAADYIDYLISDKVLIPDGSRQHYSEKIVYLPNSYQVNDATRTIADRNFTREELGLPQSGFVFCCFNNSFKITPDTFEGWMRILKKVEGSVLWLIEDNSSAVDNLRKEAEARGVAAERLVFAQRLPLADHLARHRAADLFIDTLPYNAHTTASDALWAGLPVLTCTGETFASRVAASLLTAIDLVELVTSTQPDYEEMAVELAKNPERLRRLRERLTHNRTTTPLFDAKLFAKHLENAYLQMYSRYQMDLPPEHIVVSP